MNKNLLLLILIALIIVIYSVVAYFETKPLWDHHRLTGGKVTQCQFLSKTGGGINIHYQYKVSDRIIIGKAYTNHVVIKECEDYLLGHTIPVVFNPGNEALSTILLTPGEFRSYGYRFPDSLNWILKYTDK